MLEAVFKSAIRSRLIPKSIDALIIEDPEYNHLLQVVNMRLDYQRDFLRRMPEGSGQVLSLWVRGVPLRDIRTGYHKSYGLVRSIIWKYQDWKDDFLRDEENNKKYHFRKTLAV